jgi:bromodomain adjacent to zinc finger domain protein 1A
VFVDVQGEKYYARIINVFPPKTHSHSASSSSSAQSHGYHSVGTSLSLSLEDSLKRDDPMAYFYAIRIIEEAEPGSEAGPSNPIPKLEGPAGGEAREKWASSEMEVKADVLR